MERRKVTDVEVAKLLGLDRREQSALLLELAEDGVSMRSIALRLGLNQSTVSMRVKAERDRRGYPPRAKLPPEESQYHVSRAMADVDAYVQMSVWARLARPDMAELLATDAEADQRMDRLAAEIAEKQARLDAARDGYARDGRPSLETLARIEATLAPEITQARERMNEARVGPVLAGLVLPTVDEVEAEWWRRTLPQRREVIRVLIERVEILPLRNKRRFDVTESVRIVWRRPKGAGP
jgi:hypothetical protein